MSQAVSDRQGTAPRSSTRPSGPTLATLAPGEAVEARPRGGDPPRRLVVVARSGMDAAPILAFEGEGQVTFYEGNYSEYLERRAGDAAASKAAEAQSQAQAPKPATAESANKPAAKAAKLSYAEKQEFAAIEARIEAAETRATALEAELNDPAVYRTRGAEIPAMTQALADAKAEVERLYARWAELSERA